MAVETTNPGKFTLASTARPIALVLRHAVAAVASGTTRFLSRGVKNMQLSRMQSVLRGMSDEQLATIGLEREDIPAHAKKLVEYEYDGL